MYWPPVVWLQRTAMGVELVRQVHDAGAPGVHVYTFNQHAPALDLLEGATLRGRLVG